MLQSAKSKPFLHPKPKAVSAREDKAIEKASFASSTRIAHGYVPSIRCCFKSRSTSNALQNGINPQCCCQTEAIQGILSGYCSWTCCYVPPTSEDEAVAVREVEAATPAPEDKAVSVRGVAEGEPCVTSKDCPWVRTVYQVIVKSSWPLMHVH